MKTKKQMAETVVQVVFNSDKAASEFTQPMMRYFKRVALLPMAELMEMYRLAIFTKRG